MSQGDPTKFADGEAQNGRRLPQRPQDFGSEFATQNPTAMGARAMQAFISSVISDEYDMDATEETTSWSDRTFA